MKRLHFLKIFQGLLFESTDLAFVLRSIYFTDKTLSGITIIITKFSIFICIKTAPKKTTIQACLINESVVDYEWLDIIFT